MRVDAPYVSVVMPVYNVALWVEPAVRSILRQTYTNLELVVVDDGSTDDTTERIVGIRDSRLRLVRTEHSGFLEALSTGIREARGEWIARMDGDDISHPYRFEKQIDLLRTNPDVVLCGTGFGYITPRGRVVQRRSEFRSRELTPDLLTRGRRCADGSMFFRRDAAIEVGLYDLDLSLNELSLWYKLLKKGSGLEMGSCYYFVRLHSRNANVGQVGTIPRGRDARRRYDPEGHRAKYGQTPSPLTLRKVQFGGIRRQILICRAAHDYMSAILCAIQASRSLPAKLALCLFLLALTGCENLRFRRGSKTSKFSDYVLYAPEENQITEDLVKLGVKIGRC